MINSKSLPMIDGAELMRLSRTGVIAEADGLRRELSKALAVLNPAAVVAMAMSINPNLSAAVALQQLKGRATELLSVLSFSSDELRAAQRAEQNRLAGVVAVAAHRSLEIVGAVKLIDSTVRNGQLRNESMREELKKVGLTGEKLDAAAAPCDFTEMQAQRAALLIEQSALEAFLTTRDTQHLPKGFAEESNEAA